MYWFASRNGAHAALTETRTTQKHNIQAEAEGDLVGMNGRAIRVLLKAGVAALIIAFAQNNLGGMYAKGRGVTQDDAQAVRWFRKAADQSDALAQNNLGLMYVNMRDVVVGTVPRPGR